MKTKQFSKKLNLAKETISNLNDAEMTRVKGGYITASCPGNGCPTNSTWIVCTTGCVTHPLVCPGTDA